MKEARFIAKNKEKWSRMETVERLDSDKLAANFTELSDDLSYARTFYPQSDVVGFLNHLISKYQMNINDKKKGRPASIFRFWTMELPLLMAREHRVMCFALLFFVFCCIIGAFSADREAAFVRLILGDQYVNQTLENIAAGRPMGVYKSSSAVDMFVMITINNIRVAFIAFAFGIFCSAGTLMVLFRNGIMLGAFQYFFYQHDLLLHSALSVWAHGTFEITSIIIAGGAGLVMGNSFLFPGTYTRLHSFRTGALRGIKIVVGLIPFFIVAGFIESFITRYADAYPLVGGVAVALSLAGVILYFVVYPYRLSRAFGNMEVNLK